MAEYANLTTIEIDISPNYNPKSTIGIPSIIKGPEGDPGVTYTPSVDEQGNLSWTNDRGLPNPPTVNIKGPKGDNGKDGDGSSDIIYKDDIGSGLKISNGKLCVDTTEEAAADNSKPITSSGVHTVVGNINALLATI